MLAVTLGDPVGIGPEIVARTFVEAGSETPAVAVGDPRVLRRAIAVCGLDVEVRPVNSAAEAECAPGVIDVLDTGTLDVDLEWGQVDARAGRAAIRAIEVATAAALDREVGAIVTAPINKEAMWAAGARHLGHTEMLAALTGAEWSDTMFVVGDLAIFFTTRHVALRDAVAGITADAVLQAIRRAAEALRVFGNDRPRLAVAALNPHGGEAGAFGREEIEEIAPACEAARADGLDVAGPVPADAVFHQGLQGRFDGVVSQFHDQGHIAAKTWDFAGTVSVTLGIPVVRTSVDHGTAFDIAGTGQASADTMRAAWLAAARYVRHGEAVRAAYGRADG